MDFNLIQCQFLILTLSVAVISLLLHSTEKFLPLVITKSFRYGKYADKREHFFISKCEVPKRWFKHFYIFAVPISCILITLSIYKYRFDGKLPEWFYQILDLELGKSRQQLVTSEKTLLALFLLSGQCWKRLYEVMFISVYSNATINLTHYIAGFMHYAGAFIALVGESHGFNRGHHSTEISWKNLYSIDIICVIVFVWASYEQLMCNIILANLRKNEKGTVISQSYRIPHGRLFHYISSPLQLTEILMYLMLTIILWRSSSFFYVFLWVLANQTETAISTHGWYINTFKPYPSNRRIVLPFLI